MDVQSFAEEITQLPSQNCDDHNFALNITYLGAYTHYVWEIQTNDGTNISLASNIPAMLLQFWESAPCSTLRQMNSEVRFHERISERRSDTL